MKNTQNNKPMKTPIRFLLTLLCVAIVSLQIVHASTLLGEDSAWGVPPGTGGTTSGHTYVGAGSDGAGNASIYNSNDGVNWVLARRNAYSQTTPISKNPRDAAPFYYAGSWWMIYTIGNFVNITTNGTTAVTVNGGGMTSGDVGATLSSAQTSAGTTIASVIDGQHVTLSRAATGSASAIVGWLTQGPGAFGLAQSTDGGNTWTFVQNIPTGVRGATATWMGRTLVDFDGTLHVFYTASTAANPVPATGMTPYETHPLSQYNLAGQWSSGVNFYTNGSGKKYDIDVIRIGGLYHAFYCDGGGVRHGSSSTLTAATYSNEAIVTINGVQLPFQSMNVVPLDNGQYAMIADRLDTLGRITVATVNSVADLIANTWSPYSTETTIPNVVTNGTTTVTSSAAFTPAMAAQHWSIQGTGIPVNTTIVEYTNASTVTVSTATGSGAITATVGSWADNIPAAESPQQASLNGCLPVLPVTTSGRAVVADFNGDGHPDFVLYNHSTRQTAIWYMNNNVHVDGAMGPTITLGWVLECAEDFNDDSHPDYVLFNPTTHQTQIWYMSGPTHIGSASGPALPSGWELVETDDFNLDSFADYLIYNASSHQTAIWYLHNNIHIGGGLGPTLPTGWKLVGVEDFNGDNHPDYALFNPTTRRTAIAYMSGPTIIGAAWGPTIPSGWALVAIADFNNSRHPDYLLYNAVTRQTAIWYLDNNVFVGSASGPTLPVGWSLVAQ